ncbi:hypothetical protein BZG01_19770 [Labilibaculum manganireducens]|uniref:Lipoprotein n=1 Tax=Labilibaculum manganireducens TaxID=1940525 RepID=A0A2N3HT13_9BACT|nr:hypothetical protein [Labilibaculum manganireducens]PKQ61189.1 hypothetical protein BZG01_19770 [Labilibaculum manganireducens]
MKNILSIRICCYLFTILFLFSCVKNNKKSIIEKCDSIAVEETSTKTNEKNTDDVIVTNSIFSDRNILSSEDAIKKYDIKEYFNNGGDDAFISLPDYKEFNVVIHILYGDENTMYYLSVIKSGRINLSKALDVTKNWSEPGDEGDYKKKYFEISSDYLIRIDTEEKTDDEIKKYTNNYRINNNGDFYEVKE